ncbi:MAG: site-2 protease family protein [Oscillospiraceae bacterium]|jgi:regulator of sigma E protease|nr:site-2 protease family protein [Oscillospiraceae bacterium]
MYIVLAIIIFGALIAVHELGHFVAAKSLGVKVNEFAIGMGPKLFSRQRGETLYSLRLLPIGGFCSMEGEDSFVFEDETQARADALLVGNAAPTDARSWTDYIDEQIALYFEYFEQQKLGAQRPTRKELGEWLREWAAEHIRDGKPSPVGLTPPPAENFHLWRYGKREQAKNARKAAAQASAMLSDEERVHLHPRAFTTQKPWKRVVILAAGAFMNLLAGLIIVLFLRMGDDVIVSTRLAGFMDGFPGAGEAGLLAGDEILSVNGSRIFYSEDFSMLMALAENAGQLNGQSDGTVDLVVRRDGRRVKLDDFPLALREYEIDGQIYIRYGLLFEPAAPTLAGRFRHSLSSAYNLARLVKFGLVQLVTGQAGLREMSGPVGIVSVIGSAGSDSRLPTVGAKLGYIFELAALIAINLGIFNLLPLPALDGGRIFGLIITVVIEKLTRRRLNPKYEGVVHAIGFAAIIVTSLIIMINDVVKLIKPV